jgi:hypothetical protein
MISKNLIEALDFVRLFAEEVARDMKLSDAGDSYIYIGSMNNVEDLKKSLLDFHDQRDFDDDIR